MNTFGDKLRISIFGESHGPATGVVIDGIPPGLPLGEDDFAEDIRRRSPLGKDGATSRHEADRPEIVSGVFNGFTTGSPLTIVFENGDIQSEDYTNLSSHPRPSHADYALYTKFNGFNDPRGGGHSSGRLTLPLVAAGTIAKKVLGTSMEIRCRIQEIGGFTEQGEIDEAMALAAEQGDSLGGILQCRIDGVEAGYGEPFFDSLESVISHLVFSVPGVKGIEFGTGFQSARMKGSERNDRIAEASGRTFTNNEGGINGGVSNGNPIEFRVAVKPTPSISIYQETFDFGSGKVRPLKITGRHDVCFAHRVPVIIEACAAIALAQFLSWQKSSDSNN